MARRDPAAVALAAPIVEPSNDSPLLDGSPQMRAIVTVIENVADTDATVLIRGESGVGKDLARGAFTGAHRRKHGQFESAHRGTIYLDELAELPPALQAKLLHVLQDFQFSRVGGHELLEIDTRVVAATNRDLEEAMARGEFREDLYYRLNVVEITVPPLRERREEIPALASRFLARFNSQYGRQKQLMPETLARLTDYSWPGNVRELENVIRRLAVLDDGEQAMEALMSRSRDGHNGNHGHNGHGSVPPPILAEGLREVGRRGARDAERKALLDVLDRVSWNRTEAARILKVSYKTLLKKISECGLTPPVRC